MFDSASSFSALVGIAVDVVNLFMALLSFVESAPRSLPAQGGQRRFSYFNIVRDNSRITRGTTFAAHCFWTCAFPRIGPVSLGFAFTCHARCRSLPWRQSFSIRIFCAWLALAMLSLLSGFA